MFFYVYGGEAYACAVPLPWVFLSPFETKMVGEVVR